ncbi:MAG: hypothetical protein II713_02985 [Clostridia bacterium]|nr:hypothetical protein [Clostridia bacterium]
MDPIDYTVIKIDGDYAVLLQDGTENTILVARALLPEAIEEGVRLRLDFEDYSYSIL